MTLVESTTTNIDNTLPHFKLKAIDGNFISSEELMGEKPTYALLKNGKSQVWESDGGFITHKEEVVGVAENKWQKARENACERACRYLTCFNPEQIFVSCSGPGFVLKNGGGATGPLLDMLKHCGVCVTENVNEEQEFKAIFKTWVTSLI